MTALELLLTSLNDAIANSAGVLAAGDVKYLIGLRDKTMKRIAAAAVLTTTA